MSIHQWPFLAPDVAIQEAFDIAMDYLEFTGQAESTLETQRECAYAIFQEWNNGKHHRIWLANKAIVAVEAKIKQRNTEAELP